jgi:hypothetical protein
LEAFAVSEVDILGGPAAALPSAANAVVAAVNGVKYF